MRNTVYNVLGRYPNSKFSAEVDMQDERSIRDTLEIVFDAMIKEGYDPIKQFSGFILSEDPTYIPVTNGARNLIRELSRDEMLSAFIKNYFEQK